MSSTDLDRIRAFFAPRAPGWAQYVAKDAAQIERAVREADLCAGMTVLELGCGTAPAAPFLRTAVGPGGRVIALDVTPEMIAEARAAGRAGIAELVVADVHVLPFADAAADALHAGGIVPHLADPEQALHEWARVARPGARLSVFHAIGRVKLAAIHSRAPSDDDVIAPRRLQGLLERTGWRVESIDDAGERYLALARRAG
jgi:SAM-dependent methyltransferase